MSSECRELSLSGWEVSLINLDYGFGLVLESPDEHHRAAHVRIGSSFELTGADGTRHHVEPGPPQTSVAPALVLHTQRVARAMVSSRGRLEIYFEDLSRIEVGADMHYEAWQISGPDGFLVCIPGGEIADLPPREDRLPG
ncbi:MAG TPA: DUF6188 family protein [Solirubrobacteraceae bacterium]